MGSVLLRGRRVASAGVLTDGLIAASRGIGRRLSLWCWMFLRFVVMKCGANGVGCLPAAGLLEPRLLLLFGGNFTHHFTHLSITHHFTDHHFTHHFSSPTLQLVSSLPRAHLLIGGLSQDGIQAPK